MPRAKSARDHALRLRRCFRGGGGAAAADAVADAIERRHGRRALDAALDEFELLIEADRDAGVGVELARLN